MCDSWSDSSKDVVKKERWIQHYSSSHKILLVGEGDFSFSASLARAFGSASNMVATSLDPKGFLCRNYDQAMSNIQILESRGCRVMHNVDATRMANHDSLKGMIFDRIIFNFPLAGFFGKEPRESQILRNQMLILLFLENAKQMISEEGEIHTTHKSNGFFLDWKLENIASIVSLWLIQELPFNLSDYTGYCNKYGFGGDRNFNCIPSKTYKFALKLPESDIANDINLLIRSHETVESGIVSIVPEKMEKRIRAIQKEVKMVGTNWEYGCWNDLIFPFTPRETIQRRGSGKSVPPPKTQKKNSVGPTAQPTIVEYYSRTVAGKQKKSLADIVNEELQELQLCSQSTPERWATQNAACKQYSPEQYVTLAQEQGLSAFVKTQTFAEATSSKAKAKAKAIVEASFLEFIQNIFSNTLKTIQRRGSGKSVTPPKTQKKNSVGPTAQPTTAEYYSRTIAGKQKKSWADIADEELQELQLCSQSTPERWAAQSAACKQYSPEQYVTLAQEQGLSAFVKTQTFAEDTSSKAIVDASFSEFIQNIFSNTL